MIIKSETYGQRCLELVFSYMVTSWYCERDIYSKSSAQERHSSRLLRGSITCGKMIHSFLRNGLLLVLGVVSVSSASDLENRVKCSVVSTVTQTVSATAYSTSILYSTSTVYAVSTYTRGVAPPASTSTVTISEPPLPCSSTITISDLTSSFVTQLSTQTNLVTEIATVEVNSTITSTAYTTTILNSQITLTSTVLEDHTSVSSVVIYVTTTETVGDVEAQTSITVDLQTVSLF